MKWIEALLDSIIIVGLLGFCLLLLITLPAIVFIGILAVGAVIILTVIIKLFGEIIEYLRNYEKRKS